MFKHLEVWAQFFLIKYEYLSPTVMGHCSDTHNSPPWYQSVVSATFQSGRYDALILQVGKQLLFIMYSFNTLSPHDELKHHFKSLKTDLILTMGFRINIAMKLIDQYMAIFFNFSPTSNNLHPLQVENCDSNSRLVVDVDTFKTDIFTAMQT